VAFRDAMRTRLRQIEEPCERGLERLEAGDEDGAANWFHEAFLALPRLSRHHMERALTLIGDERWEKALEELDRALELNPGYPDLHNFRGVVLCELDRLDEAIEAFRQSSDLNTDYLVPRLNLAFAAMRAGRYEEAEIELESILEIDPGEPAAIAQLEELRSGRRPEKRRPVSRGSTR